MQSINPLFLRGGLVQQGLGEQLSKDDLERLIDGFEKAKHAVLEAKQTEWKRSHKPQGKTDPAVLYPASAAIKVSPLSLRE